ncbi:MAG TPA: ribonuclease III [Candidatus Scybalocola faecigallinarum]|uniref:Ribonuclease 3 n=1 Tax=Candidatus Scybalocola faecigallinarum TaxID=2840941 RepID=A0A9D1F648_9FIRM|nr:ribonuclease III [Candidatus Scybalocola faecigallinarum]
MERLQKDIKYQFRQESLLRQALTHSSYANEHHLDKLYNNERLEFLGDAVLEVISSDTLFRRFPQMHEGQLSKKRASLVCEPALAYSARQIHLGQYLRLGHGEDLNGGRERDSILSDALEALIGAMYLDGGFEEARKFIMNFVLNDMEHKELFHDSKTALQELVQSRVKETVTYDLIEAIGPEHNRRFVVQAMVGPVKLCTGEGRTKQAAGQDAAYKSILKLKDNPKLLQEF